MNSQPKQPVRAKVIASSLGALVAAVVALTFDLDPDVGKTADKAFTIAEIALGAFFAGYFKRETRA